MPQGGFEDLPPALLPNILAFVPGVKARIRLATVAKPWRAALASSDSHSHDGSLPQWQVVEIAAQPDPPVLQQDVLAALTASGIEFCLHEGWTSWAWLPLTVRHLSFEGPLPADCPVLACVEEVVVEMAPHCTKLDVTRFPNARALTASFEHLVGQELQTIPWLGQLVQCPQLTRVELRWGVNNPGRSLVQLPAGCELHINTWGWTLFESLPRSLSLAHVVTLRIRPNRFVDFSCLASCPNLRHVSVQLLFAQNPLDMVDLSTLNHVPDCCSVELNFEDAVMCFDSFKPPAGWSVDIAPGGKPSKDELILSRNG